MSAWIYVGKTSDIDEEDLIRFDHEDGRTFAIYNTEKGFFATDGYCTHEEQHLEDGLVIGTVIECPLHQGRFEITNGKALSAPVCEDLKTYMVKLDGDDLYIEI